jgi:hypothetical protein
MDNQTNLFLAILAMDAYNRNADGSFKLANLPGISGLASGELGYYGDSAFY